MSKVDRLHIRIVTAARRLRLQGTAFTIVLAAMIGFAGGYFAIGFKYLIMYANKYMFLGIGSDHQFFSGWHVCVLPCIPIGGLILVGLLTTRLGKEAKGHGVPEVMSAVVRNGGIIRARMVFVKMIASALCIGSGGSVGREGPIVQIGSAIGSTVGQFFKMSGSGVNVMVACGAAAGISATFNAPIAGTLFAAEVILGGIEMASMSSVLVSSLVAASVARAYFGNEPAFIVPEYIMGSYWELGLYCALGIVAGLVAVAFTKTLYKVEDVFNAVKIHWVSKAVIGGLIIGITGIFRPEILGVGYHAIELTLNDPWLFSIPMLVALCMLKIVMTSITIGAGGSGGIFAPSLFMGAMIGGGFGIIVQGIPYFSVAPPGAYALVGMSAVVAGTTHAPIQAILILFEMTDNYQIILPIMISCVISKMVARKISSDSIYTLKLSRRGELTGTGKDISVLENLHVRDVMDTRFRTIPRETPFYEIVKLIRTTNHDIFPVVNETGEYVGIINFQQIRQTLQNEVVQRLMLADDLLVRDEYRLTSGRNLLEVFNEMAMRDVDCMPVVDEDNENMLIGLVTRQSVMARYRKELLLTRY